MEYYSIILGFPRPGLLFAYDFYHEHINTDDRNDMAKTRGRFKPEEIAELKKSHDYWQNARLKTWAQKYKENKKVETDIFEYLL